MNSFQSYFNAYFYAIPVLIIIWKFIIRPFLRFYMLLMSNASIAIIIFYVCWTVTSPESAKTSLATSICELDKLYNICDPSEQLLPSVMEQTQWSSHANILKVLGPTKFNNICRKPNNVKKKRTDGNDDDLQVNKFSRLFYKHCYESTITHLTLTNNEIQCIEEVIYGEKNNITMKDLLKGLRKYSGFGIYLLVEDFIHANFIVLYNLLGSFDFFRGFFIEHILHIQPLES